MRHELPMASEGSLSSLERAFAAPSRGQFPSAGTKLRVREGLRSRGTRRHAAEPGEGSTRGDEQARHAAGLRRTHDGTAARPSSRWPSACSSASPRWPRSAASRRHTVRRWKAAGLLRTVELPFGMRRNPIGARTSRRSWRERTRAPGLTRGA